MGSGCQVHDVVGTGAEGLGAVLRTALDALVVMRVDGTVAGWNEVAERTFGWSFAEARGRRMSDLIIPAAAREAHERGLAAHLAGGVGPIIDVRIEVDALHRDGREIPVELLVTRTDHFGEPVFLGFIRDVSDRRDAARRQELMIGELNHRVKNLLGVVVGIAHQTARGATSVPEFSRAFEGRVVSLARAHEILTAASWERASLDALCRELFGPYLAGDDAPFSVSGPDVLLPPRHILSLSMILHELLTNAVKYGALSCPDGRVSLLWSHVAGEVVLRWSEYGVPGVRPPERKGFGTRMVAMSVAHELHGRHEIEWRGDGMDVMVAFGSGDAS